MFRLFDYSVLTHNVTLFEKLISNEPGIASKFCLQIWTFQEGLYQTSLFRKRRFLVIFPSFLGLGQAKMRNTQELKPTVSSQQRSDQSSSFRSARFGTSGVWIRGRPEFPASSLQFHFKPLRQMTVHNSSPSTAKLSEPM